MLPCKQAYIYIYSFSRRFYPKRLTVHSGYTFFVSICLTKKGIMSTKVLKSHYILTLQSKYKKNAFKAEVKFTKLKMKAKKD